MTTVEPLPLPPGARTALVVIDMQAFFFRASDRRVGLETVVANINRLIDHFDARGLPVVHAITTFVTSATGTSATQLTVTGPGHVRLGAVWSSTVIVCVHRPTFPHTSVPL